MNVAARIAKKANSIKDATSVKNQLEGVGSFFAGLTEKRTPDANFFDRKFTKSGKAVATGIALWGFGSQAVAERNHRDMGVSDGRIHNATPSMQQYMQAPDISAGASGDLVFALNNCRSTGFLG